MGKLDTTVEDGKKTFEQRLEEGREWLKRKKEAGWEYTPDGWQSPQSILEAGYIKNSEGEWCIQSEEYIADGLDGYKEAGQKYWAPARKYLSWRKKGRIEYGTTRETSPDKTNVERLAGLFLKEN